MPKSANSSAFARSRDPQTAYKTYPDQDHPAPHLAARRVSVCPKYTVSCQLQIAVRAIKILARSFHFPAFVL
jgi:hypothetical protein